MCEHLGISVPTGKRVKGHDDIIIRAHLSLCNHAPGFEDFSVLSTNTDYSPLNKNQQSLPLELFDS